MPVLSTRLRLLTGASSLRDFSTKPEKFLLKGQFWWPPDAVEDFIAVVDDVEVQDEDDSDV